MIEETAQSLKVEQTDMGEVLAFPSRAKLDVVPGRKGTSPNKGHRASGRSREYLTSSEVGKLIDAAKKTARNSTRNHALILVTYRHGLRVGETSGLMWSDIDFEQSSMFVRRLKGSKDSSHPIDGDELRLLRKLKRESSSSAFVFTKGDGTPMAPAAIASMVKRLGDGLFDFPIHVHMLRHACGYYLANKGVDTRIIQDYMGHQNIQHTVRYTALAPGKFKGLWS